MCYSSYPLIMVVYKQHLIKDSSIYSQVQQAITLIVGADRKIALTAIQEVYSGDVFDPNFDEKTCRYNCNKDKDCEDACRAVKEFQNAESQSDYKKKIDDYKKAWKHINKHCDKLDDGKKKSCIESITLNSFNGDIESIVGDKVKHPNSVFTDSEGNQVAIHTSCSKCLMVGQVIDGWTITEIIEREGYEGTLAQKCAK